MKSCGGDEGCSLRGIGLASGYLNSNAVNREYFSLNYVVFVRRISLFEIDLPKL